MEPKPHDPVRHLRIAHREATRRVWVQHHKTCPQCDVWNQNQGGPAPGCFDGCLAYEEFKIAQARANEP